MGAYTTRDFHASNIHTTIISQLSQGTLDNNTEVGIKFRICPWLYFEREKKYKGKRNYYILVYIYDHMRIKNYQKT